MKYKSFTNKLKKRLGVEDLNLNSSEWGVNGRKEWLVYEGTVASWRVEPSDYRDPDSPRCVTGFHTKGVGQESDAQTDYFPGTYWRNATQLIDRLQPPPAKFTPGNLVRGKLKNKRAMRHGYAGKAALVIGANGHYMSLKFVAGTEAEGDNTYNRWSDNLSYPVRDFELLSK